jgi:topoisomerase-4 subunit A
MLTKLDVSKVTLKSHGSSTLGGLKVWFDSDVKRLNYDGQGLFLGEFNGDDQILVILKDARFYLTNFDLNNHYEDNILRIEKYDASKVWTCVYYNSAQSNYLYIKRFRLEALVRVQNFMGEMPAENVLLLTDTVYPRILVTLGGTDAFREPIEVDAEQYIGIKSFKAIGKRITTLHIGKVEELEPTRFPEEVSLESSDGGEENPDDPDTSDGAEGSEGSEPLSDPFEGKSQQDVADEMNGQLRLDF